MKEIIKIPLQIDISYFDVGYKNKAKFMKILLRQKISQGKYREKINFLVNKAVAECLKEIKFNEKLLKSNPLN